MSLHFQAATLVDSPSYPNAVMWSEENLVAVASGRIVTILNPAMPCGPRGLINIPASEPFSIGVIERTDLLSTCLLPTALSRDIGPHVQSISWSPIGLSPNSGCLLAVCTTNGLVKLYRMPCCEFSAEWIEVLDVSEMLHTYLSNVGFEESAIVSYEISDEQEQRVFDDQICTDVVPVPISTKCKRRKHNTLSSRSQSDSLKENTSIKRSRAQKTIPDSELPLMSAEQYASRNAMLSSLVVAWSPILHVSPASGGGSANDLSTACSILAVGAKSGRISFWRIHGPNCYSITNSKEAITASLIGHTEAHCTWITAASWALYVSDPSKPLLLLATGSSDGSAKIWQACSEELLTSEVSWAPFSLMKEITIDDSVPISSLALIVPSKASHKSLLAIGKGSGSIEVWSCDIPTSTFEKAGTYNAHDQIVTGLAWAFDGNCLYSCSQDNTICSWILHENFLCEAPIPSNTPGLKSSTDVPCVFDSCYGLAISPGNLVVAVARSFDADLLNPMYQKRALKAAIEFLWIGGQQLDDSSNRHPDFDVESFSGFPEKELVHWESKTLWSLNLFRDLDKPLVTWDVIAALLAFKQSIPKYTEHILLKWLGSCVGESVGSLRTILSKVSRSLRKMTSRQLNLINIITRHVVFKELKADKINGQEFDVEKMTVDEEEKWSLWMKLLVNSEMELRHRLVSFSFSAISSLLFDSSTDFRKLGCWIPAGLAQMEQWVALNKRIAQDKIKLLTEDITEVERSKLHSLCEYVVEERCSFCSALVPFESAEVAFCQGEKSGAEVGQRHKLARCAVSMRVCPATPTWYCASCQRRCQALVPKSFFAIRGFSIDSESSINSVIRMETLRPFCPFCGILSQRLLPEFLLSASPV